MSMMGKILFFLGLQIFQNPRGIFIKQSKYALESLKKYGFDSCDLEDTPMVEKSKMDEDKEGKVVDPSYYRGMIGTLLYLTASRPDLQFAICMCARYQARPTEKHLLTVKRVLSVSKRNRKSRTMVSEGFFNCTYNICRCGSCWLSRYTPTKAEYIAMSGCCAQILWMRSWLTDYGLGFNKIPMYCDNKSAITLTCNNVQHSRSKHIDIRFLFINEHVENGVIELYFVNTEYQLAYIFTKALDRNLSGTLFQSLGGRDILSLECIHHLSLKGEDIDLVDFGVSIYISLYPEERNALIRDLIDVGVAKVKAMSKSAWTEKDQIKTPESQGDKEIWKNLLVGDRTRVTCDYCKEPYDVSYDVLIIIRYSNPMIQPELEGSTQGYPLGSVEVLRYDKRRKSEKGNNAD
ncbi:hypothetical protein Tco_1147687 [Tanacetum coccineum]